MISVGLITAAALLALAGAESWAWRRSESALRPTRRWLGWVTGGLLFLNLVGSGLVRRHIPPLGLDEMLLALTAAIWLIYLKMRRDIRPPGPLFGLGLLLATLFFISGAYWPWSRTPHFGWEPLWLWGLLARWPLIAGLAGLYWLALLSALSWWEERSKGSEPQKEGPHETERALTLGRQLRSAVILLIFWGSLIFSLRDWWGWGQPAGQKVILAIVFLLLLAAWWLRFTWPRRQWWIWSLTILAFLAALPALAVIAG